MKVIAQLLIYGSVTLAMGQTRIDLRTQTKSPDLSNMGGTKTLQIGTTLPATCVQGQVFFNTAAAPGSNLYGCVATNIWSALGGGGTGGSLTIEQDGTTAGIGNSLDFLSSPGNSVTVVSDGSALDVTAAAQTSYFATRDTVQAGTDNYCVSSSNNNTTYTCAQQNPLAAYSDGMRVLWKPDVACGNNVTLNIDGNGAAPVYQNDGVTPASASQCSAGHQMWLSYDAALNSGSGGWRMLAAASGSVASPLPHLIAFAFDGGGTALSSGQTTYIPDIPFACVISGWSIAVDQGTASADVWVIPDGTTLPTAANRITASAMPTVSGGLRQRSTNVAGWSTAISAHSVLAFNLASVSGATKVSVGVECDQ